MYSQIQANDCHSTSVCQTCWHVTYNFHLLYKTALRTEANLIQIESVGIPLDDTNRTVEWVKPPVKECHEDNPHESSNDEDVQNDDFDCRSESVISNSPDNDASLPAEVESTATDNNIQQQRKEKVEQENQQIRDFFSMNCEFCNLPFRTVNERSLHYNREHNKAGYLTCCGKKFYRRFMALQHIQEHLNPGQFK